MRLEVLVKPFSAMNEEEALELIRRIRLKRFTVREKPVTKSTAKKGTPKAKKVKAREAIANMTPEERAEMIRRAKEEIANG